jgi:hypothetical protein
MLHQGRMHPEHQHHILGYDMFNEQALTTSETSVIRLS